MDSYGYYRRFLGIAGIVCVLFLQVAQPQEIEEGETGRLLKAEEKEDPWDAIKFKEEADQTYNLVFHKYNNRIRPPDLYIKIDLTLTLAHFRHLDVGKQELQTVLDLELNWMDSRLRWLPYKVQEIYETTDSVWVPDLVYINGVSPVQQLYPEMVRVKHNGSVSWMRKEIVTTRCEVDMSSSEQACPIRLGFVSNSLGSDGQGMFYFSDISTASLPDGDISNTHWRVTDLEMNVEDENETMSATLDLVLRLEMAGNRDQMKDGDRSMTTANGIIGTGGGNTQSGGGGGGAGGGGGGSTNRQTGNNCGCNGSTRSVQHDSNYFLLLSLSFVISAWLLGSLRADGKFSVTS